MCLFQIEGCKKHPSCDKDGIGDCDFGSDICGYAGPTRLQESNAPNTSPLILNPSTQQTRVPNANPPFCPNLCSTQICHPRACFVSAKLKHLSRLGSRNHELSYFFGLVLKGLGQWLLFLAKQQCRSHFTSYFYPQKPWLYRQQARGVHRPGQADPGRVLPAAPDVQHPVPGAAVRRGGGQGVPDPGPSGDRDQHALLVWNRHQGGTQGCIQEALGADPGVDPWAHRSVGRSRRNQGEYPGGTEGGSRETDRSKGQNPAFSNTWGADSGRRTWRQILGQVLEF